MEPDPALPGSRRTKGVWPATGPTAVMQSLELQMQRKSTQYIVLSGAGPRESRAGRATPRERAERFLADCMYLSLSLSLSLYLSMLVYMYMYIGISHIMVIVIMIIIIQYIYSDITYVSISIYIYICMYICIHTYVCIYI